MTVRFEQVNPRSVCTVYVYDGDDVDGSFEWIGELRVNNGDAKWRLLLFDSCGSLGEEDLLSIAFQLRMLNND